MENTLPYNRIVSGQKVIVSIKVHSGTIYLSAHLSFENWVLRWVTPADLPVAADATVHALLSALGDFEGTYWADRKDSGTIFTYFSNRQHRIKTILN